MLLKVTKPGDSKKSFTIIADVKKVEVDTPENYVLAYAGLDEDSLMSISAFKTIETDELSTHSKKITINRNALFAYDYMVFNPTPLLDQLAPITKEQYEAEEPYDDKCWPFKAINVIYLDGMKETLLCLTTQTIYILNDEGQTIDVY